MRKIVAIENVTLDGFADSREGLGFEWTARAYDDEVDRYSNGHVRSADRSTRSSALPHCGTEAERMVGDRDSGRDAGHPRDDDISATRARSRISASEISPAWSVRSRIVPRPLRSSGCLRVRPPSPLAFQP